MPLLETEEEAKKRVKPSSSSSSSSSSSESENDIVEKTKTLKKIISNTSNTPPKKQSSSESDKEGKGLKITTPNQLLTKLTILLPQKKAGNKSQKLNNEIRQILCIVLKMCQKLSTIT